MHFTLSARTKQITENTSGAKRNTGSVYGRSLETAQAECVWYMLTVVSGRVNYWVMFRERHCKRKCFEGDSVIILLMYMKRIVSTVLQRVIQTEREDGVKPENLKENNM
jgi:hypothetical protein